MNMTFFPSVTFSFSLMIKQSSFFWQSGSNPQQQRCQTQSDQGLKFETQGASQATHENWMFFRHQKSSLLVYYLVTSLLQCIMGFVV